MSAPSAAHEARCKLIMGLATLAGLTVPSAIGAGLIPDVVRSDSRGLNLLVGDAKASESPGCSETARRLRRYFVALWDESLSGVTTRVVLAVSAGSVSTALSWSRTLEGCCELPHARAASLLLGDTSLVWIDVPPVRRHAVYCLQGSTRKALVD